MAHEESNEYESKSQMKRVEILKAGEHQINHEELLATINESSRVCELDSPAWSALRAVVELHKPDERGMCAVCSWMIYPGLVLYSDCLTIQEIEKELK